MCSTVDRAEQFGADPEMFLLGVATLLHRCNIAMIYFSLFLDEDISKILMFRLPTLASILDAKAEEEQSEKCEVELNIYLLKALPVVLNQNCEFAVQCELRTNIFHKVGSQTETHPVAALVDPRFAKTNSDCQS